MEVLSIHVGMPREVEWKGKRVATGIFKQLVAGPVRARFHNLDGDGQADLTVHGGVDKAVYAYSRDAYPWFESVLGRKLADGAFGENLTVSALDEKAFGVGDVYAVGSCELEVSEPRFPCFKLGILFEDDTILKTFTKSDRPGIYFRIVREGELRAGDRLRLVRRHPAGVSLHEMYRMKLDPKPDPARVRKLLEIETLNESWRERLRKKAFPPVR